MTSPRAERSTPPALGNDLAPVIELYKIAVEMADRVSARRTLANAFFLSVQSTLLSVAALSMFGSARSWPVSVVFALVGMVLSGTWWVQLRSYRDLNRAKFAVINEIELQLPVQPFGSEWQALLASRSGPWLGRYADLGSTERIVPGVFVMLHLLLLAGRLVA
ncbi:hypothetical protein ABZ912_23655 [Nonomuraea angiospora]|uniref:RipA family octameric membrane protein n=1 Tax=Nonomuraea angiospora TaxID=46172 RepID=UPI0033CD898E